MTWEKGGILDSRLRGNGLSLTSLNWGNLFAPECVLQSGVR